MTQWFHSRHDNQKPEVGWHYWLRLCHLDLKELAAETAVPHFCSAWGGRGRGQPWKPNEGRKTKSK
eukprot:1006026-Amphidinium_carterae.1